MGSGTQKYFGKSTVSTIATGTQAKQKLVTNQHRGKRVGGHTQLGLEGHSVGDRTDASCMSMASAGIAQPTFQTDNVHLAKTALMRFTRDSSEVQMIQKGGKSQTNATEVRKPGSMKIHTACQWLQLSFQRKKEAASNFIPTPKVTKFSHNTIKRIARKLF